MAEFLRVIDIETTGFAPPEAEVIEVGWQDVVWSGESWRVSPEHAGSALFGCTKPCPPQAQAVHHIADRDLRLPNGQMRPPFSPEALHQMFGDERLVYVAHNAEFER